MSRARVAMGVDCVDRDIDARDRRARRDRRDRRERRETCRAESRRRARRSAVARDDRDMSSTARDSAPTDRTTTTTNAEATAETPREEEGAYESALRRVMSNLTDEGSLEAALRDAASAVARGRGRARDGDRFATTTTTTATMGDDVERDGETEGMVSSSPRTTTATTGTRALLEEMDADEESAAAEQSRLARALSAAERGTPMVALFLMIFVYKNFAALAFAGWLVYVLMRVNAKLVRCVSEAPRRGRRRRRRPRGGDVDDARGGDLVIFADGSTRETFVSTVGDGRRRWVRGESVGRDHLRLVDAVRVRLAQNRRGGAAVFGFTTRGEKESRVDDETLPDARVYRRRASFLSAVEYANLIFRVAFPIPDLVGVLYRARVASFLASWSRVCTSSSRSRASPIAVRTFSRRRRRGWDGKSTLSRTVRPPRARISWNPATCARFVKRSRRRPNCGVRIFCQDCIGEWFDRQPARGRRARGRRRVRCVERWCKTACRDRIWNGEASDDDADCVLTRRRASKAEANEKHLKCVRIHVDSQTILSFLRRPPRERTEFGRRLRAANGRLANFVSAVDALAHLLASGRDPVKRHLQTVGELDGRRPAEFFLDEIVVRVATAHALRTRDVLDRDILARGTSTPCLHLIHGYHLVLTRRC